MFLLAQELLTSREDGSWDTLKVISYLLVMASGGLGVWYKQRVDRKQREEEFNKAQEELGKIHLSALAAKEQEILGEYKKSEHQSMTSHYESLRKQQNDTFTYLSETLKTYVLQISALQQQITDLRAEVYAVKEKLEYYEENPAASHARDILKEVLNQAISEVTWLFDPSSNHWYLSKSYCEKFHVIYRDFWQPVNIYGMYDQTDVLQYTANDMAVLASGTSQEFIERVRVRITDPKGTEFILCNIRKTPITVGGNMYVFGQLSEIEESP